MAKHNIKKPSNKLLAVVSRPISPIVLIVCTLAMVLVFSILLNLKFWYSCNGRTVPQLDNLLHPTLYPTACKYHGFPPRSDYLVPYTVQKGDTLLSIAREKLGDPSRVT